MIGATSSIFSIGTPTTTALSAVPASPQTFGTSVTFTANVTFSGQQSVDGVTSLGIGIASAVAGPDVVTFTDNGTPILNCSSVPATPSTPVATCSTSSLAVGSHTIVATYGGGSGFAGSVSNPLTYVIYTVPIVPIVPIVPPAATATATWTPLPSSTASAAPSATGTSAPPTYAATPAASATRVPPSPTATAWVIEGDPVFAAVLRGNTQLTLSTASDAVAPGQTFTLSAIMESYAGSPSGTVAFLEGSTTLGSVPVHDLGATLSLSLHALGVHYIVAVYHGPKGEVVRTTPIAMTVGNVSAKLTITNQKHTVVGGRMSACDAVKSARSPYQVGCEVVFSDWLPGAKVTFTLSYADGSSQTFTGTADGKGHLQHVFAVKYQPTLHAKHGQPVTRAWISVVTESKDGSQAKSVCLRFAVLRKS